MIDVEARVFDAVYPAVTAVIPAKNFKSQYVPNPAALPFATLYEVSNTTDTRRRGTALDEEYAILTYEANIYALSKAECRSVMDALDTAITRLGFTRTMMQFIPNLADTRLYRMTARYQAAADGRNVIYRRW